MGTTSVSPQRPKIGKIVNQGIVVWADEYLKDAKQLMVISLIIVVRGEQSSDLVRKLLAGGLYLTKGFELR